MPCETTRRKPQARPERSTHGETPQTKCLDARHRRTSGLPPPFVRCLPVPRVSRVLSPTSRSAGIRTFRPSSPPVDCIASLSRPTFPPTPPTTTGRTYGTLLDVGALAMVAGVRPFVRPSPPASASGLDTHVRARHTHDQAHRSRATTQRRTHRRRTRGGGWGDDDAAALTAPRPNEMEQRGLGRTHT